MRSVSRAAEDWFESTPMPVGDGFARAICGAWRGQGFSLAVGPSRHADRPCFLALHQTTESLSVAADRGFSTLSFDRDVTESVSGRRLVREAGMWFVHPATPLERRSGEALTLISMVLDKQPMIASGGAGPLHGPGSGLAIAPVNTAPFAPGETAPEPGTRGRFAAYDLADASREATRCRSPFVSAWPSAFADLSPQAVLDDPTAILRAIVARQDVLRLMTTEVADDTAGDLAPGAHACAAPNLRIHVWIERVREGAVAFDQLQYIQATTAQFAPAPACPVLVWPQVRVATLRRVTGRRHPALSRRRER